VTQLPDGRRTVILKSQPGNPCDEIFESGLVFSPDGGRLAYGARTGKMWHVVVDGQEGEPLDFLGSATGIRFSPDGRRLAFAALSGSQWCVILDGRRQKAYENLGSFAFSPAGTTSPTPPRPRASGASCSTRSKASPTTRSAKRRSRSARTTKRLAYAARSGQNWLVVTDGQEGKPYKPPSARCCWAATGNTAYRGTRRVGEKRRAGRPGAGSPSTASPARRFY